MVSRRRVVVDFVAEMSRFRAVRDGAKDVKELGAESRKAKKEVADLGDTARKTGGQVDAGLRDAAGKLRDARVRFVRSGQDAGEGFGEGFSRGLSRSRTSLLGGVSAAVGEVGRGLPWKAPVGLLAIPAAAAAAEVALEGVGAAATAVGGAIGALPGLVAGSAASIGTLAVAFNGLDDAVEAVWESQRLLSDNGKLTADQQKALNEALAGLAPQARSVVREVGALYGELTDLRRLAQARVLAGMDRELRDTAQVLIPFARRQVIRFGDTWNETFRQVAALGRNREFLSGLDAAFAASDRFFDNVNDRIPATGKALAQLFRGSTPFVDAFGDSMLSWIDDFTGFIDDASRSGDLGRFFADAGKQADALLDLTKEIVRLAARLGGLGEGSTLLRDMADAAKRFNDESYRMADVEQIVATGREAISGVVDVLRVLGPVLGETLTDPAVQDAVRMFFDAVGVGAQIVAGLVQLFGALPDPIQSTVLAGVALAILWGRLTSVTGSLSDAVGRASDRLRDAGPAGVSAARGLDRVVVAARAAGAVLVALQITALALRQFSEAELNVRLLSRAVEELGETGQRSGELVRKFGEDAEETRKIYAAAGDGWWQSTNRFNESIPIWGGAVRAWSEFFHGQSFSGARENIAALDRELANYAATTDDVSAAQAAYTRELQRSGLSADEFAKLLPEANQALRDAWAGARGLTSEQQLLNGTMKDAIDITGGYTQAWQELYGAQLSSDQAALAAIDAIERVGEAFDRNGKKIEGNSRAAVDNRVAVQKAAEAAAAAAQAKYDETRSVEAATAVYDSHIDALRRELDTADLTDEAILSLIGTYTAMPPLEIDSNTKAEEQKVRDFNFEIGKVPGDVPVKVTSQNFPIAQSQARTLRRELENMQGTYSITVRQNFLTFGKPYTSVTGIRGSTYRGLSEGGLVGGSGPRGVDSEPRLLAPDEFVVRGEAVRALGLPLLERINRLDETITSSGRRAIDWMGLGTAAEQPTIQVRHIATQPAVSQPSGGVTIERLELRAFSDRFSLRQVQDELAWQGVS